MGTLAPWIAAYLKQQCKQGRFTRGTAMRQGYTLGTLDESFGDRLMETFGQRAIERWLDQHEEGSASTRRTYLSAVKMFTKWLSQHRLVKGDPFADIKMPKVPRPIDRDGIEQLP